MKYSTNRPQRSFVVEYKSNRRQPKEAAKSIWADTDLRAISEAVADDMTLPVASVQREDAHTAFANAPATAEDRATRPSETTDIVPLSHHVIQASERNPEPAVAEPTKKAKPKRKLRGRKSATKRKPVEQRNLENAEHNTALIEGRDELASLELENRELRKLLVEKLRNENATLAAMLQRCKNTAPLPTRG